MTEKIENIDFVLQIEKYPCLYDCNLPEYLRRDVTEKAWATIAQQVKSTVTHCKDKWKNLRAVFVRKRKLPASGECKKPSKPYYLNEYMQFIIPHIKPSAPATGNQPCPSPVVVSDQSNETIELKTNDIKELQISSQRTSPAKTLKRKSTLNDVDEAFMDYVQQKQATSNDCPRKCFLLSLLPEVNELNETQFKFFKRRALKLLDEITCSSDNS